jgi:hypothetical protein
VRRAGPVHREPGHRAAAGSGGPRRLEVGEPFPVDVALAGLLPRWLTSR